LGLGAANAAAALGHAYPVAGGLSQTAVNEKAGARTPLALVFASITLALCLLFLTDLLENLPKVVQKLIEQRQRAAEEFFRLSKADNPSESIAFSSETTPPYRTGRNKPPKS